MNWETLFRTEHMFFKQYCVTWDVLRSQVVVPRGLLVEVYGRTTVLKLLQMIDRPQALPRRTQIPGASWRLRRCEDEHGWYSLQLRSLRWQDCEFVHEGFSNLRTDSENWKDRQRAIDSLMDSLPFCHQSSLVDRLFRRRSFIALEERKVTEPRTGRGQSYTFTWTWNQIHASEVQFRDVYWWDLGPDREEKRFRRSSSALHFRAYCLWHEKHSHSVQLPRSPLTWLQPDGGTGTNQTDQAAMDKEEGQVMKPKRNASQAWVAKSGRQGRAEPSMEWREWAILKWT